MKKTLSLLIMAISFAFNAQAQLANGYYRVQNTYTDRYISIEDNYPQNYPINKSTGSVDMSGIKTYKPGTKVTTSPSTILYVTNVGGNQYDIVGQGTSIHYISGGRFYINLAVQSDGSYQAYGTYSGVDVYLKDDSDPDKQEAYLKPNSKSTKAMNWWAKKVDTSTEYLGIQPDFELNGKYYGTIYASFPFRLISSGMKAYTVTSVAGNGFEIQEISGDIPDNTPVIIECSSNSPSSNIILPVESDADLAQSNLLFGTFCDRVSAKFWNVQVYDATCMRSLTKNNGKLAFKVAGSSDLTQGAYLKANKAYLLVPTNSPDVLVLGGGSVDPEPGPGPGPDPEPEPTEFTTMGVTYAIGEGYTATIKSIDTIEGPYEISGAAQNPNNGLNYTVTGIGKDAFANQTGLTGVSIPASVTTIGKRAFSGCSGLVAIYCYGEEPATVGESAFDGVDKDNCIIHVPDNTEAKYAAADGWKEFTNIWATGIREIKNETTTNERWYSLDGREINQPTKKGVYINNGKKIVIK